MTERTELDDAIDEAIEELIDDDTKAFHLVTVKDSDKKQVNFAESWYDSTEKVPIADDMSVNHAILMLTVHAGGYTQRIQDEHSNASLKDTLLSIDTVAREMSSSQRAAYKLLSEEADG
jgi:hypothetical protein